MLISWPVRLTTMQRFDGGLAGDRLIGDLLQLDDLAAQPAAVAGDQHAALGVLDALCQRLHGEAAVDHAVHRADLGAGQHGDHQLGDARHVDGDAVAFLARPCCAARWRTCRPRGSGRK